MSIEEEMRAGVRRALMIGIGMTVPAWKSVPTDPCQPTGEMKNVVSTDITPLVNHLFDAIMPLVKRAQAEARAEGWEAAAHRVIAMVDGDGMIDQHRVVFMTNPYVENEGAGA